MHKPNQNHREWNYKDSFGAWWSLAVDAINEDAESNSGDDYHWKWHYEFKREDVLIDSGELQGQYNIVPVLSDVLYEFGNYLTSIIVGMAAYGKEK